MDGKTKCSVEGCAIPAEPIGWPDGDGGWLCQEHWEAESGRMWWEELRAAALATASVKNAKGGKRE